ncbi:MAG TPA: retroviral-like aspartic protease family protein [Candidatus Baltobacteraceae bacterium]|nr:retroviral-like aspartic protease family protein [Candidatus Baltobacteraceae bacterium]
MLRRVLALCAVFLVVFVARTVVDAQVALTPSPDGHQTVPVFVNGRGPYPFILDTGADGSAVYQWFARFAKLKTVAGAAGSLSGQTGTADVPLYKIDDLAMSDRHIEHVTVYGLPDRHDAGREAGVLGTDYMDGAIIAFDFPCGKVDVYAKPVESARAVGDDGAPVSAATVNGSGLLSIPISVNGYAGTAVIDTGSRDTRMTPAFARAAGIDTRSADFHNGAAIYGANSNRMTPRVGPIGTVRFANVSVRDARAEVIDLPVLRRDFGSRPAMLLGSDLLGKFRLVYDHQARRIWIRASACAADPR